MCLLNVYGKEEKENILSINNFILMTILFFFANLSQHTIEKREIERKILNSSSRSARKVICKEKYHIFFLDRYNDCRYGWNEDREGKE